MRNTILRLPNGVELSDAFLASIQSIVGNNVTVETYTPTTKIDTQKPIQRRLESLKDAFIFLVNANSPPGVDKAQLIAFADTTYGDISLVKDAPLASHSRQLTTFTSALIETISTVWNIPKIEAIEYLNKAEQYHIASRERQAIATVVKLSDNEFNLAYDKPKPALHPDTIKEMHAIKDTPDFTIPEWFIKLDDLQKLYIHSIAINENTTLNKVKTDFETLIQMLNVTSLTPAISGGLSAKASVIDPADNHQGIDAGTYNSHQAFINAIKTPPYDESYYNSLYKDEKGKTSLNTIIRTQKRNEKGNATFMAECLSLKQRPLWFFYLSDNEQALLQHLLKNATDEAIETLDLPSRLRTIPGLANHLEHCAYLLNEQGIITEQTAPKERASHPSSRDVKDAPFWIGNIHVKRNLDLITAGHPNTLIQTLISPMVGSDNFLPDPYLHDNLVEEAITHSDIMHTNHPLNTAQIAKSLGNLVGYSLVKDTETENINKLINLAKEALNTDLTNRPALQGLLDEYQHVIDTPDTIGAHYARQLVLSSLEQLIAMYARIHAFGACVSGKDRKAIEIMHSDSEWIYYIKNKCWPKFQEPNQEFVNILVTLYTSGHQQTVAEQGAPGSFGIKSPGNYLPRVVSDTLTALGCNLDEDDKLASLNEVRVIMKNKGNTTPSTSPNSSPKTNLTLNATQKTQLLEILLHLTVNYKHFWGGAIPAGVEEIKNILLKKDITEDQKIDQIFKTAQTSLGKYSPNRSELTTSFYTAIQSINRLITQPEQVNSAINDLKNFNPYEKQSQLLTEPQRNTIVKQLEAIIGDAPFWTSKYTLGNLIPCNMMPTGICHIRELMLMASVSKTEDVKQETIFLAEVFAIIDNELNRSSGLFPRSKTTQDFYACLNTLYNSENPEKNANLVIQQQEKLQGKIRQFNDKNPSTFLLESKQMS